MIKIFFLLLKIISKNNVKNEIFHFWLIINSYCKSCLEKIRYNNVILAAIAVVIHSQEELDALIAQRIREAEERRRIDNDTSNYSNNSTANNTSTNSIINSTSNNTNNIVNSNANENVNGIVNGTNSNINGINSNDNSSLTNHSVLFSDCDESCSCGGCCSGVIVPFNNNEINNNFNEVLDPFIDIFYILPINLFILISFSIIIFFILIYKKY